MASFLRLGESILNCFIKLVTYSLTGTILLEIDYGLDVEIKLRADRPSSIVLDEILPNESYNLLSC